MENIELLKKCGLTESQSKAYYCLLESKKMTPTDIAKKTGESRENCYAILKKLETLGIIEQTNDSKTTYRAKNPSALEALVEKRRKVMVKNEKLVKDNISSLLNVFYLNNNMPGARTQEGLDGIMESYNDILRTKKDVYLIRTKADDILGGDYKSKSFLKNYRDQLPILGIHTYALTPVTEHAKIFSKIGRDQAINLHRTWMPADAYTAPVAIQVYGEKVALIDFSDFPMATTITSPAVAESFRQIIKIMIDFYQANFSQNCSR